jgi:hypothetical protein
MKLRHMGILILALVMLMSQVSAADNVTYFNNTTKIEFEGVDFNIPAGFGQLKNSEDYDGLGSDGETCFYINEAQGNITITVISDWMGMTLDELKEAGSTKLIINGHTGWNYTKDDMHCFAYLDDDKGVIVGATNETRLAQVII